MRIQMESHFDGIAADVLWEQLQSPEAFQMVARPLMGFKSSDAEGYPKRWILGRSYSMQMLLCGILPLGSHTITFIRIDPKFMTISTNEHGLLIKAWHHTMDVRAEGSGVRFRDQLDLSNGMFTWPTYAGVYLFFKYRHLRMKSLIRRGRL